MSTKRKSVRWPGRPWSTLAKLPRASATLRVKLPWQADPFATPMPRPGDLDVIWDRMWDASGHTFLMSTRRPDRLCRFVLSRAYRRGFGWTDMDRTILEPGDHVSFDDLYYRNQCGCVGSGEWQCLHPANESMGHVDSCHEYECPVSDNVQDRKTLREIGVADDYEYDDEGFTEDSTSWQEMHSRPRYGAAANVWLGFVADTQEQFEVGARLFRGLRDRIGPYLNLFAETTCPVRMPFGYYENDGPRDNWSPADHGEFTSGSNAYFVPCLNWIVEQGTPREIPSRKMKSGVYV